MTTINAWTYEWDDNQPRPVLTPPTKSVDEAAPLIDLVERNRCDACGTVPKHKADGRFVDCLTPACAAARAERKRLIALGESGGQRQVGKVRRQ